MAEGATDGAAAGPRGDRAGRRGTALAVLLLVAVPAWVFRDLLLGRRVLVSLDVLTYIETKSAEMLRAFAAFRLPLWSPHVGCGVPFFAEMDNAVLSPFNLLLLLGPRRWLEIAAPLWCVLAGLAMYAFLRELELARVSASTGALSFGAGGLLVFYVDNPPYLGSAVYVPLLLLCWHRALIRRSFGYLALAAVALTLMLFAGDIHHVYYAIGLTFLYGLVVPGVGRRLPTVGGGFAVLGLVTVLLSAVQMLPTFELAGQAPRQLELTNATESSFHPARLLELAVPFAYGMDLPDDPYRGGFLHRPGEVRPWTRSIYTGVLPLLLLPLAFAYRRTRRLALLFAAVGAAAFAAAAAEALPVYRWLYTYLPFFDRLRVPSKTWLLVTLAQSALVAMGVEQLRASRRARLVAAAAVVLAAAAVLVAVLAGGAVPKDGVTGMASALAGAGAPLQARALHLLVATVALAAAALVVGRKPALVLALPLLHAVDLTLVNGEVGRYFGDPRAASRHPVPVAAAILADAEERGEPPRLYHDERLVEGIGYRRPYRLRDLTPAELRKLWDRSSLDWNHALLWDLQYVSGYTVLQDGRPIQFRQFVRKLGDPAVVSRLSGRLGARYLVLPHGAPTPPGTTHAADFESGAVRLLTVDHAVPRVYLARHGRAVPDAATALEALALPGYKPRRLVLLEVAEDEVPFPGVQSGAPVGQARMVSYQAGRVVVEVDVPEPRYLVFGEALYKGWRVTVDGAPRPSYRANFMHQAIALRPGERRVEFRYLPRSFVLGAWLSGLSWLGLAAYAVVAARRSRRPSEA